MLLDGQHMSPAEIYALVTRKHSKIRKPDFPWHALEMIVKHARKGKAFVQIIQEPPPGLEVVVSSSLKTRHYEGIVLTTSVPSRFIGFEVYIDGKLVLKLDQNFLEDMHDLVSGQTLFFWWTTNCREELASVFSPFPERIQADGRIKVDGDICLCWGIK